MCRTDQIVIRSSNGETSYFNTKRPLHTVTVLDLKKCAVKTFPKSGPSVEDVRLVVGDKTLDVDSASVSDYGVKSDSVVQMVRKVHGG